MPGRGPTRRASLGVALDADPPVFLARQRFFGPNRFAVRRSPRPRFINSCEVHFRAGRRRLARVPSYISLKKKGIQPAGSSLLLTKPGGRLGQTDFSASALFRYLY